MIIDFHTHIFPEKIVEGTIAKLEQGSGIKACTDGRLQGLLASMDRGGVDCSVILPVVTAPKQFQGINRFSQEINQEEQERMIREGRTLPRLLAFGGLHPHSEDCKAKLRELKDRGFKGIKLHPDYQGVFFNDIRYKRIVEYASELDLAVVVHAGMDIGLPDPVHCTAEMCAEVLKETQAHKLVLAHLGGWQRWNQVEELLVGKPVYFDTAFIQSYIERDQFERIVKNHGSDKIMFATDSPWMDQEVAVKWLEDSNLSEEDRKNISCRTALRLMS